MSDPLRKSEVNAGRDGQPGGGRSSGWIGDLSGAFADLGTFLPLIIGLLVLGRFEPTGLLLGFGLFGGLSGLIFRLPMPVQPMKVVAALAIAGGLSAPAMAASGVLLGLALLILGGSGLIDRLHRLVPRTVLIGIQLGLGLHLLMAGIDLASGALGLGFAALGFLLLLQITPFRALGCLLLVGGGIGWSLITEAAALPVPALAWHLPSLGLPGWEAISEALARVFWPQLALTVVNAVLLTSVLAADYFPEARERTSARRIALSSGALNLLLAPIGAMPMCHGAGGLAAQVHQGAVSGLAPILFGTVCLALGLFAGPAALCWLLLVPLPIVAALLAYAGFQLVQPARLTQVSPVCIAVIMTTALIAILVNVAAGLAAGLIAELLRSSLSRHCRPST